MGQNERDKATTADPSDAAIIASSEADAAAFGIVFERHIEQIYTYVVRRVGPTVAEELTAETFAKAFEHRARFEPLHESAGPWLYGIATNVLHKAWRAERRQLSAFGRWAATSDVAVDDFDGADDRVDAEREAATLLAALGHLEPGDRDALLLFAWEGLSYEEIGAALEIPTGTVASRINRARRRLKDAPAQIGESMGVV
jgi:RNA polymerase sigma-70 factor (ECF subfamily)